MDTGIGELVSWRAAAKDDPMQMVKIRIPSHEDRSKALVELARRGRVICLPDNEFVVPERAPQLLASLNVAYHEVGRGGFDYAEKTLRVSFAAQA